MSSNPPSSKGFTCDRCSHCCRVHRVPLTGADLVRLAASGKDVTNSVEFLGPFDVDMTGEPESFAHLKEGRRMLFLRHDAKTGGCVFLGERGCNEHPARPSACRTYPFDRPEQFGTLGAVPGALCPPDSGLFVTLRRDATDGRHAEFMSALQQRDAELNDHALCVAAWNRRQRTRVRLGRAPETRERFLRHVLQSSGHHA